MAPILISVDALGFAVRGWHTAIALATLVGLLVGPPLIARLEGLPASAARRALLWVGAAAFAGGRLHVVLAYWSAFAERPIGIVEPWVGGLLAPGAFLGMAICAPFICRAYRLPLGRFADALVPTVGLGIAIARVGCVLQGCCFGKPCHAPWCVVLPNSAGPVHPLPVYYALVALLVAGVARTAYRWKRYDGEVALLALASYAAVGAGFEMVLGAADASIQLGWIYLVMATVVGLWSMVLLVAQRQTPVARVVPRRS